jgi:molybdopterin converting factor small subunit
MVQVRFTRHLSRYFPDLEEREEVAASTVAEVVAALDDRHPGLGAYIVDERGSLRKHVNIFLGQELIHDRTNLLDPVEDGDQVFIFQALSGG